MQLFMANYIDVSFFQRINLSNFYCLLKTCLSYLDVGWGIFPKYIANK